MPGQEKLGDVFEGTAETPLNLTDTAWIGAVCAGKHDQFLVDLDLDCEAAVPCETSSVPPGDEPAGVGPVHGNGKTPLLQEMHNVPKSFRRTGGRPGSGSRVAP